MVTHKEAVEAAILLDKYCAEIHHDCTSEKCVFGELDCPFEFGKPYYTNRKRKELREHANKLEAEEKCQNQETF